MQDLLSTAMANNAAYVQVLSPGTTRQKENKKIMNTASVNFQLSQQAKSRKQIV